MKRIRSVALVVAVGVAGLACGHTSGRYTLAPGPNSCQRDEVRTFFSTTTSVVCWDEFAKPIGMAGAGGTSPAAVVSSGLETAAILGAAGIVSSQFGKIGRVGVSVDPANVQQ